MTSNLKSNTIKPKKILIEAHFLPSIPYFSYLYHCEEAIVDDLSLFIRQSYRNRARILGANKVLDLTVPVSKGKSQLPLKDVLIDYSTPWQKKHLSSIISAYNNSPFFQYYADDFCPLLMKKEKYLLDYNIALLTYLKDVIKIGSIISFLSTYTTPPENEVIDLRNNILPPKKNYRQPQGYTDVPYTQVFLSEKSFIPSLSIIDLLFNTGNESIMILRNSFD